MRLVIRTFRALELIPPFQDVAPDFPLGFDLLFVAHLLDVLLSFRDRLSLFLEDSESTEHSVRVINRIRGLLRGPGHRGAYLRLAMSKERVDVKLTLQGTSHLKQSSDALVLI